MLGHQVEETEMSRMGVEYGIGRRVRGRRSGGKDEGEREICAKDKR